MSSTKRIEKLRKRYIDSKPSICYERARIYTESHKKTEGKPVPIQRAQAFCDFGKRKIQGSWLREAHPFLYNTDTWGNRKSVSNI
ncbi:pyruvate-formate lyase [Aequitasia blattaphilus]|uniref:PFL domain-containing protein n=1 Tax=Aequitasia blattaphilus TaxID=2949332 RepID=A0ABT1EA48_9FIRM|nr:pyruvate formate lyase family protein [Aequitasia blattaphilus]MCP1102551.1 hypothetical protein [Aequitasia blattaphilus]MCR8615191.1 hypothetical protein [Aequitasia blattaphilus]